MFLVAAVLATIVFAKSPGSFLHPSLPAEDGRDLFASCHDKTDRCRPVASYGRVEYVALGTSTVARLAGEFPTRFIPYVYALASLLIACLPGTLLLLPMFDSVLPDPGARGLAAALISVLPLGNFALQGALAYSHFNLLVLACLLCLGDPATGHARCVRSVALATLVWCHPLTPVLLPLFLLDVWIARDRFSRGIAVAPALSCVAYFAFGLGSPASWSGLTPTVVVQSVLVLVERVGFESLFGTNLRMALRHEGALWFLRTLGALLTVTAFVVALRRPDGAGQVRHTRPVAGILGYLVLGLTLASLVARPSRVVLETGWAQRHTYVPRVLFVLLAIVAIDRAVRVWRTPRWLSTRSVLLGALPLALLVAYHDRSFFAISREEGQRLRAFLADVTRLEERSRRCGAEYRVRLDRGEWSIPLAVGSGPPTVDATDPAVLASLVVRSGCP